MLSALQSVALVALLAAPDAGSPESDARIEAIRALYSRTNAAIAAKKGVTSERFSAAQLASGRWQWLPIRSDAEWEKEETRGTITWIDCRPAKAVLEFTSQSGDWATTDEYYFDSNGAVAFHLRVNRTWLGGRPDDAPSGLMILEDRYYFDATRALIRHLTTARMEGSKYKLKPEHVAASPVGWKVRDASDLPPARRCAGADAGR